MTDSRRVFCRTFGHYSLHCLRMLLSQYFHVLRCFLSCEQRPRRRKSCAFLVSLPHRSLRDIRHSKDGSSVHNVSITSVEMPVNHSKHVKLSHPPCIGRRGPYPYPARSSRVDPGLHNSFLSMSGTLAWPIVVVPGNSRCSCCVF